MRGQEEFKRSLVADGRHSRQEMRMAQQSKRESWKEEQRRKKYNLAFLFWSMFYLVNSLPDASFAVLLSNLCFDGY